MYYWPVITFFFALTLWGLISRIVYLQKKSYWVETQATILSVTSKAVGEFPTPFVDISYQIGDQVHFRKSLNTNGRQTKDYPPGSKIAILVNPSDPSQCMAKTDSTYDPLVKRIFARFIPQGSDPS